MISLISHKLSAWRFSRELKANLKARKQLRPQRRQAALKGWERRRQRT